MKKGMSLLGLLVLFTVADGVRGFGAAPAKRSDLDAVRSLLETARPHIEDRSFSSPITVDLRGYQRHWDLDLGKDLRAIVISRARGAKSEVLLFSSAGSLLHRVQIGAQVDWLLLFDFDEDGVNELILDQVDGWGTGILLRSFRAFRAERRIQQVWEAISLNLEAPPGGPRKVIRGFVRCEPAGGGTPYARLLYLKEQEVGGKRTSERLALKFQGNSFTSVPWPGAP